MADETVNNPYEIDDRHVEKTVDEYGNRVGLHHVFYLQIEMAEAASADNTINRLLGELVKELDKKNFMLSWKEWSETEEVLI